MADIKLTKDSDALICAIYKNYLENRKNGISKSICKNIGSSEDIQKTIMPEWSFEDVDETCRELHRANLLTCHYADNVVYDSYLSDESIFYMENRFKNGLSEVLDYFQKIKFW
ncbi:MAG: hypothetical protein HFJ20_01405 [Clostridia bacterium]|nr:hypothetical protein [Clostridia bacterium]